MSEKIIGYGTWYDKMATRILERERKLGRSLNLIRTEMGLGASGFPHIGSFGDSARSYAVTLALQHQGFNSELIAFADDMDGLRKVPAGLPQSLEKYVGKPVTSIPDPFGCHESFGEHMNSLLLEALDSSGIKYKFVSGREVYKKGLLKAEIETLLQNGKRVGEIVKEEVGQEKYVETLPYFPVCSNCGRIYTTKAHDFLPEERRVSYKCEGMELRGRMIDGCGHEGEADYSKDGGKLSWKVEFAARWKVLDIRFEAYGKDIADSVRINDRICEEILHFKPPMHAKYEMFLDKSGKKISKSVGNVFTPQVWFRYGSPQSLLLLMLKRFIGTRSVSVTDIPQYMRELDELEDIHFGKKIITDDKERAKRSGLYRYCWLLKPPSKPSVHVPYNLLTYLSKLAPKGNEFQYVVVKLRGYGYIGEGAFEGLKQRIQYALNWVEDFEEIKPTLAKISLEEAEALEELIPLVKKEEEADQLQSAIFNTAKKHGVQPGNLFKLFYRILLGVPEGPRLGPYILAMGKENVVDAVERVLKEHNRKKGR